MDLLSIFVISVVVLLSLAVGLVFGGALATAGMKQKNSSANNKKLSEACDYLSTARETLRKNPLLMGPDANHSVTKDIESALNLIQQPKSN